MQDSLIAMLSLVLQQAHEAFKVAQSLEPSYLMCWIGQVRCEKTKLYIVRGKEDLDFLLIDAYSCTCRSRGSCYFPWGRMEPFVSTVLYREIYSADNFM